MAVQLRIATLSDLEHLLQIARETYRYYFKSAWTRAGMEGFLDAQFAAEQVANGLQRPETECWVLAYAAEQRVGFAKVVWQSILQETGEIAAELQKIYFLPEAIGKGFGKAMLERVEQEARIRNFRTLWLDVLKSNSNARDFYSRNGFAIIGEREFTTDLQEIGMHVMAKSL